MDSNLETKQEINFNWNYLILFTIGIILVCIYLIVTEIYNAKEECNNIDGDYKLNFKYGHICNGEKFSKHQVCRSLGNKMECIFVWDYYDTTNEELMLKFFK